MTTLLVWRVPVVASVIVSVVRRGVFHHHAERASRAVQAYPYPASARAQLHGFIPCHQSSSQVANRVASQQDSLHPLYHGTNGALLQGNS